MGWGNGPAGPPTGTEGTPGPGGAAVVVVVGGFGGTVTGAARRGAVGGGVVGGGGGGGGGGVGRVVVVVDPGGTVVVVVEVVLVVVGSSFRPAVVRTAVGADELTNTASAGRPRLAGTAVAAGADPVRMATAKLAALITAAACRAK